MKSWVITAFTLLILISPVYAQQDCVGAPGDLCHCCDVTDMIYQIRNPGGGTSSWFTMEFSGEDTEECGIGLFNETYVNNSEAYGWCPEEGDYDILIGVYSAGGANCDEYAWYYSEEWEEGIYTVDYDGLEEWCECYLGSGHWDIGGTGTCCGDDVDEGVYDCQYGADICRSPSDDFDTSSVLCECEYGPDSWNIDGTETCCGDDGSEVVRACEYTFYDACQDSNDDEACCPSSSDCVFNNMCYSTSNTAHSGDYLCSSGDWKDNTPPTGVSVTYNGGFYTSYDDYSVDVSPGTDPESDIDSAQFYTRTADLDGSCGIFGTLTEYGDQDTGTPSVLVDVESGKCYMFAYRSFNRDQISFTDESQNVLMVDRDRPSTFDYYVSASHGGDVNITIICEDPHGSGCALTEYCINISDDVSCTPNLNLPSDGVVTVDCGSETICDRVIKYHSIDNAGNSGAYNQTDIIHIDESLPTCEFLSPEQLVGFTNISRIYLVWEGNDPGGAGIKDYEIMQSIDGSDFVSLTGEVTYTAYDRGVQSNQRYDFKCVVTNNDDESSESSAISLFIDALSPTAIITVPEWTNDDTVTVEWNGVDTGGSNISRFVAEVNTGSGWSEWFVQIAETGYIISGSEDYTFDDEGSVSFRVHAVDRSSNTGPTSEKTVVYDTTPPICAISALDEYQTHNTFPVSWSGFDSGSGSGNYTVEYSTDGSLWATLPGADLTEDTTKPMAGSDGNTYYFRCKADDNAGNEGSWSSTVSTIVDSNPPDIDDLDYESNIAGGERNNISVTVTDTVGIESVTLTIDNVEITPAVEQKEENEWEIVWSFTASGIGTKSGEITAIDINGNSLETTFDFIISICTHGETRECDPKDPETGVTYSEGICEHTGTRSCVNGTWGECKNGTLPSVEECNDLDDNCDGEIDEDENGDVLTKTCGTNTGICSAGLITCIDGNWSSCSGESGPNPEGEMCGNNLDDDCDGDIDEGCDCSEGDEKSCGESDVGECRFGIQQCENGKMGSCKDNIDPVTEVCDNGLDDDCDGDDDNEDDDCGTGAGFPQGYDDPLGTPPDPGTVDPFSIGNILMLIGVIVMGVLLYIWYYFKKRGQEPTWENVMKKWGSDKSE